jgi:sugar phosphate isomerase/epimerase
MERIPLPDGTAEVPATASSCFRRIHAHIPLPYLRKKLGLFLERALDPEIYLNCRSLEKMPESEYVSLASLLEESGRKTTIHGPFFDLSPGAVDPGFRALTLERMRVALERARLFRPDCVVFHPGYDPVRFGGHSHIWLKNSIATWKQLLPLAERMPSTWLLLENIFERNPSTLAELLAKLPSPPFGFCLDTGHFQVFSELPLSEWFEALGPYLREVHLHDNSGRGDDHLPPGRGTIDFDDLFHRLSLLPDRPIGTVESHSEADLLESLAFLKDRGMMP